MQERNSKKEEAQLTNASDFFYSDCMNLYLDRKLLALDGDAVWDSLSGDSRFRERLQKLVWHSPDSIPVL